MFCLCRQLLHFPGSPNSLQIIFCCPHLTQLITSTGVYICFPSICQDSPHSFSSQTWCWRWTKRERYSQETVSSTFSSTEGMTRAARCSSTSKVFLKVGLSDWIFLLQIQQISGGKSKELDSYLLSLLKWELLKSVRQEVLAISFQSFSKTLQIELLPLGSVKWPEYLISSYFNVSLYLRCCNVTLEEEGDNWIKIETPNVSVAVARQQCSLCTKNLTSPVDALEIFTVLCGNCSLTPGRDQKVEIQKSYGNTENILVRIKSSWN